MATGEAAAADDHFRLTFSSSSDSFNDPRIAVSSFDPCDGHSSSSVEDWLDDLCPESFESSIHRPTERAKRKRGLTSSSLSADPSLIRVPLKKRHLHQHLVSMDPGSASPLQNKNTSVSTSSKSKSTGMTALSVKDRMAQHRIYRDHANWMMYPEFRATVQGPFDQARHYNVRPSSEELFSFRHDYYQDGNEESYKHKMFNMIIKDEFDVLLNPGDDDSEPVYGPCRIELAGIVSKYSARLRPGHLPHAYINPDFDPKAVQQLLQKEGMTTPEPDGIWGFDPAHMPQGQFQLDTYERMTLCKKMHWPFFTVQCKVDSDYDETLNQSCRDGAAINHASLQILSKAGYPVDQPGPNHEIFSYSMTMDKKIVQWWVHWTEVNEAGHRNFHMNSIAPMIPIEGIGILGKLRDKAQAIIEWGLNTRMPQVLTRYPAIFKADEEARDKALKSKTPADRKPSTSEK
ncbi:MAG: hypothetical protein LQ348_007606 [Seirophora lacunosa]|nr:MAG: hypothetical protein LQ348_007606 [Seirophora lacunosa]